MALRTASQALPDLFKVGEVSSVDPVKCTARVVFDDEDSINSYDLPIMQRNTFGNHDFQCPDVGEDVLVMFLGPGQEDGFIIGSFYAGEVTPPESSQDKRTVVFKDGTRFSYDRSTHVLTATIDGTEIVFDRKNGSITVPQGLTINCTNQTINASSKTTINSPLTEFTGNVIVRGKFTGQGGLAISGGSGSTAVVTGSVEVTQDVKASGISLVSHTHTEQGDGAETSGPH